MCSASHLPSLTPTDSLADWLANPFECFARWQGGQGSVSTSRPVYAGMWRRFILYLSAGNTSLDHCTARHVRQFLDKSVPCKVANTTGKSPEQLAKAKKERKERRQRYMRLIEKTYDHLAGLGLEMPNPGREAAQAQNGVGMPASTKYLTTREHRRVIGLIQDFLDYPPPPSPDRQSQEWARQWAAARDITLAAIMVGAGIRVDEINRLTTDIRISSGNSAGEGGAHLGRLIVPGDPPRETLCLPMAHRALAAWQQWRLLAPRGHGTPLPETPVLFPADTRLRRADQAPDNAAMHPSTIYRAIGKVLADAGITGTRVSGQVLQHTYQALLADALARPEGVHDGA